MLFKQAKLNGGFIIEVEKQEDDRGFFARAWCQREFGVHGLNPDFVQCNVSFNKKAGTLRGMHYQEFPYEEAKIVRCTKGSIYDVIVDLGVNSPTYKQWLGVELTAESYRMLYIPEHFAHGFCTLENNTEVTYLVSQFYSPNAERGIRYDDPAFGILWPCHIGTISEKDRNWLPFLSSDGISPNGALQTIKEEK